MSHPISLAAIATIMFLLAYPILIGPVDSQASEIAEPLRYGGPSAEELSQIESKLDLGNPYIADTAMIIAADYPGEYNLNQVCQIYNALATGAWFYFPEAGVNYLQNANLSLQRGKISNTIGRGDCDDFAILMASLIESLGGSARITFAFDDDNDTGHAYAEVYLGQAGEQVNESIAWLKNEYPGRKLPGLNHSGEEVWLNLDWWVENPEDPHPKDPHPGGPYFGEGRKIERQIVRDSRHRTEPKIVPLIDSMDNIDGWEIMTDGNGSSLNISSVTGMKGNAIQLSYNLLEGGWIGIAKKIDPEILYDAVALNVSYKSMEGQDNLELRLVYEDGTAFRAYWITLKTNTWSAQKAFYYSLKRLSPQNERELHEKFEIGRVKRLEFIVSDDPEVRDEAGSGTMILDDVRGLMAIPAGSPWARIDERKRREASRELADESEREGKDTSKLIESVKRAAESLRMAETFQGDQAMRHGLDLLPRLISQMMHNDSVTSVAFSPDGKKLATASHDSTARLWDLMKGKEPFILKHNDTVSSVSFSPDGKKLATASDDSTARLWDVETGKELQIMKHGGQVRSVSFSPDGKKLATASDDVTARLWDVETGKELQIMKHGGQVRSASFSPDGKKLATASDDVTARLWDVETGQELRKMLHDGQVRSVSFSPDGKKLATASIDGTARLWDVETGKELRRMKHGGQVRSVSFSPDGKKLAMAGIHKTAEIWDLEEGEGNEGPVNLEHNDLVNYVSFSPDGKMLVTISDNLSRVWSVEGGRELARMEHSGQVNSASFSPDGKMLATASDDKRAIVWSAEAGGYLIRLEHDQLVYSVAFSPDGLMLASASNDKKARISDAMTGKELAKLEHNAPVRSVSFSPDGKKLATACNDRLVRIWDNQTGSVLHLLNHEDRVYSVAFSPDGHKLATASNDSTVHIWDLANGTEEKPLEQDGPVTSVAFSPDGLYLASASYRTA